MGQKNIKKQSEEEILAEIDKEEKEQAEREEKVEIKNPPKAAKASLRRAKKTRSGKYKESFAKVDRKKLYDFEEALKLVKETSYAKFDATIEAHFHLAKKEKTKHSMDSENNIHLVLGKVSESDKKLTENFQTIIATLPLNRVDSIVLSATMGPGIKVRI